MAPTPITIDRFHLAALRVALHLVNEREEMGTLSHIKLEAAGPNGKGRMIATDGFALLISENAHNARHTMYVQPKRKITLAPTTAEVVIVDDQLIENRPRTTTAHDVTMRHEENGYIATRGDEKPISARQYPDVDRVVPPSSQPPVTNEYPVDAVRGGKVAIAYGDSPYRSALAWARTSHRGMAHLHGAHDDDLILLATMRNLSYDRYTGQMAATA